MTIQRFFVATFSIGLTVLFALAALFWWAAGDRLVFGQDAPGQRMPYDGVVTKITVRVPNMKAEGFADYCLATMRFEQPLYQPTLGRGGYVESMCFNMAHKKEAGEWVQMVDLSETPIFMPEGTSLLCNSLGSLDYYTPATPLPGTCTVHIERYEEGNPRYRMLRLPYWDQVFSNWQPLVPAYYGAWREDTPLEVDGVFAYVGNNYRNTAMDFCLLRLDRASRRELDRFCIPPADEQSPGLVPLRWTIEHDELLGITCSYPRWDLTSSGDCVAGVIVEIPPALEVSAENPFRDYGLVPREYVGEWCETAADTFKVERVDDPMLCRGEASCTRETKISNCYEAFSGSTFPLASCMETGTCFVD